MMEKYIVVVAFILSAAFIVWNDGEAAKHDEFLYGFNHAEYCEVAVGAGAEHCAGEE